MIRPLLLVTGLLLVACSAPTRVRADALEAFGDVRPPPVTVPTVPELASLDAELDDDASLSIRDARESFEDRRRELTRRSEDQQERGRALGLLRTELTLWREVAVSEARRAVERAEQRVAHAEEDLVAYRGDGRRRRLEAAALEVREAADAVVDLGAELTRLEQGASAEFGGGPDPLVVDALRRRLERAELRAELEREAYEVLEARGLPRTEAELVAQLDDARLALENARREAEAVEMEYDAELRDVLVAERQLARDAEDLDRALERLETDVAAWELERSAP